MEQVTSAAPLGAADALIQWLMQPVARVTARVRSVPERRLGTGPPSFGRPVTGSVGWGGLRRYDGCCIVMEPCPEFLRAVARPEG
ncbi:hypothetical protein SBRY_80173 [Actinacidiphila bryophytorum]|uniref:Uncharacterized protein n=1 Tax=Actinacidiphila bryophytorum TaxID=1436133 RepID=A0A9W4MK68_9ACTN|nr:hypothetical protein SBRY_80173 [Actinacidiphila bryophytorum]